MEQNLDTIRKELRELSDQNAKILYYLNSDPATKRKGLVEKLDIMEDMLNDMIVREKILKAKATVYGSVGSFLFMIVWQLVTKFLLPNMQ